MTTGGALPGERPIPPPVLPVLPRSTPVRDPPVGMCTSPLSGFVGGSAAATPAEGGSTGERKQEARRGPAGSGRRSPSEYTPREREQAGQEEESATGPRRIGASTSSSPGVPWTRRE